MTEFGYAGAILRINLTTGQLTKLGTADYAERFLGGRGIAAKIYWDEMTSPIRAFDPDNCLIFITGPVAGFTRFSGCRWQVCGKSPEMQPEAFSFANLGGSWGAWLKFAGYDGIVVTGRAEKPVYLYVDGQGRVELRDAHHLWGKSTQETQDILQTEAGKDARILGIGPAGENRVCFATIWASDYSSGASGLGAVMGSKQLKAIVVKAAEKKRPLSAHPDALRSLANEVFEIYSRNYEEGREHSQTGNLVACYGCVRGCSRRVYEAEPGRKFRSFCQATLVYLEQAMQNPKGGTEVYRYATRLCDSYGLDTTVMEPLIRWLYLCHQAGILTDEETGLPLSQMGGVEFIETLVKKISLRQGFGDVLAQGVLKAADFVGRGSGSFLGPGGIVTKAGETKDYDPRLILANALIYATEPRRAIQLLHATAFPLRRWVFWHDKLESAFVTSEIFQEIAEKYWGSAAAGNLSTYEGKALAAKMVQDFGYVKESMILCDLTWPIYMVQDTDRSLGLGSLERRILWAITGKTLDEAGLLQTGERIFNLQRAILLREGWPGRRGDTLLDFLHEEPLQSVYWSAECLIPGDQGRIESRKGAVVDRQQFEDMKGEYYALRGWDVESGLPTMKKMMELNLADVAARLDQDNLLR